MNSSKQLKKHGSTKPKDSDTAVKDQPDLSQRGIAISERDVLNSQDHAVDELESQENMARDRSMMD